MISKNDYIDHSWENRDINIRMFIEVDGQEIGYKEISVESVDEDLRNDLELTISDYFAEEYNDKLAEVA